MLTKERRVEILREKKLAVERGYVLFGDMIDDCLREIDECGRLVGELAEALADPGPPHWPGQRNDLLRWAKEVRDGSVQENA